MLRPRYSLLVVAAAVATLVCVAPALAQEPPGTLVKQERLVEFGRDGIATVQTTWFIRPPFCGGPLPLIYRAGIRDYGTQFGFRSIAWIDFTRFKVTFTTDPAFNPLIPGRARADSPSGRRLAEARAVRLIPGRGFEVEETQFGPSAQPIFTCRSAFDFDGWKVAESNVTGRKSEDYFFLWSSER